MGLAAERFHALLPFLLENPDGVVVARLHYDAPSALRPFAFLCALGGFIQVRQTDDGHWVYRWTQPLNGRATDPLIQHVHLVTPPRVINV